jgi:prepilin-type N-terminal cleavage/methylation domain-containing protein
MKNARKGFTLVELAIVLVIIGLILGAIIKGQELINNAKIKRLYNMKQEILASMYTYYDKFNAYPGDDPKAQKHLNSTTTKNGNGNGIIDGSLKFDCSDNSTEVCAFWEHLRLANILTGDGVENPKNPYGGAVSVVNNYTIQGKRGNWIAFDNLPEEAAMTLDAKYDDGKYNSGSIRASGSTDYDLTDTKDTRRDLFFEY